MTLARAAAVVGLVLGMAGVATPAVHAQQPAPAPGPTRPPGCTAPEHRQFDYWVGDWEVTDSAGTRVLGTNSITLEENGCLIHEHWKGGPPGGSGGTGQSFNFYDRVSRRWEQVRVASGGSVLKLAGGFDGTAMRLEGKTALPGGAELLNRIEWIPQPDGRVRQRWTTSRDGGQTWNAGFDGWYRKRVS